MSLMPTHPKYHWRFALVILTASIVTEYLLVLGQIDRQTDG